jgi:hypothetical protein
MSNDNGKRAQAVKSHEIVFEPPTEDTPGFLRLQKNVLRMSSRLTQNDVTEDVVDEMVELLLQFVVEPVDRNDAREALLDASRKQYMAMLNGIVGKPVGDEVAVEMIPPKSKGG